MDGCYPDEYPRIPLCRRHGSDTDIVLFSQSCGIFSLHHPIALPFKHVQAAMKTHMQPWLYLHLNNAGSIYDKSDEEAWAETDADIIGKSSSGTSNLKNPADQCDTERGVVAVSATITTREAQLAQTLIDIKNKAPTDTGEQAHDEVVIRSVWDHAIADMKKWTPAVRLSEVENRKALRIFLKVAGLAHRVHDSGSTLGTEFPNLVTTDNSLTGERDTLVRHVPTRWNSDLACAESHQYFCNPIEVLTGQGANKLGSFKLTDAQWLLLKEIIHVLMLFDAPTKPFSKKETRVVDPAIASPVIRIAAHVLLLVLQKDHSLTDQCEVYRLAIVMCPDKELQWYKDRGWTDEAVEEV
ncbi:hypothetical protein C8R43DRAFT_948954 [Mycena crocata]|nr:hypothetical protein C8R43DRAFT_948954 [Mycena crocata]